MPFYLDDIRGYQKSVSLHSIEQKRHRHAWACALTMARIGVIYSQRKLEFTRDTILLRSKLLRMSSQIRHRQNGMEEVVCEWSLLKDLYLYNSAESAFDP